MSNPQGSKRVSVKRGKMGMSEPIKGEAMFLTILHTIPKDSFFDLLAYCKQASEQDDTFTFEPFEDDPVRVIVKSPTRNIAYKRGVLLHHKFGCFFEVVKK